MYAGNGIGVSFQSPRGASRQFCKQDVLPKKWILQTEMAVLPWSLNLNHETHYWNPIFQTSSPSMNQSRLELSSSSCWMLHSTVSCPFLVSAQKAMHTLRSNWYGRTHLHLQAGCPIASLIRVLDRPFFAYSDIVESLLEATACMDWSCWDEISTRPLVISTLLSPPESEESRSESEELDSDVLLLSSDLSFTTEHCEVQGVKWWPVLGLLCYSMSIDWTDVIAA